MQAAYAYAAIFFKFVKFFRAFIPLTLQHRYIQVQGTKNSGMGCFAEMFTFALSMETWTLSRVWYFGVNCGVNRFLLLLFEFQWRFAAHNTVSSSTYY